MMNKALVLAFVGALAASSALVSPQAARASVTEQELAAQARAQDALPQRPKTGIGTQLRVMQSFAAEHAAPRIIQNGQAPLHDYNYVFVNQFDGVVGNQIVNVYAGYYRFRPTQGVFMVTRSSLDLASATAPQFVNGPPGMGALRVSKIEGTQLTLTSERGATTIYRLR
jgi:hypothetical protein